VRDFVHSRRLLTTTVHVEEEEVLPPTPSGEESPVVPDPDPDRRACWVTRCTGALIASLHLAVTRHVGKSPGCLICLTTGQKKITKFTNRNTCRASKLVVSYSCKSPTVLLHQPSLKHSRSHFLPNLLQALQSSLLMVIRAASGKG
jgi:hypothetical protein